MKTKPDIFMWQRIGHFHFALTQSHFVLDIMFYFLLEVEALSRGKMGSEQKSKAVFLIDS
jgi:hypothetical protein